MRQLVITSYLILTTFSTTYSQWRDPLLTHLSAEDGLIAGWSKPIQDSIGHIYLATDRGLFRYDGSEFEFFGHDLDDSTSIGRGYVQEILEDRKGQIWLGLYNGGLNSFNRKTNQFHRWVLPGDSKLKYKRVKSIYESSTGELWIGANDARLVKLNRGRDSFSLYSPDWLDSAEFAEARYITNIAPDLNDANILWMNLQEEGILGFSNRTLEVVRFNKKTGKFSSFPCEGNILDRDVDGALWVSNDPSQISKILPDSDSCISVLFEPNYKLKPLSKHLNLRMFTFEDDIHIATATEIFRYTPDNTFVSLINYPEVRVGLDILLDKESKIWISGTSGTFVFDKKDLFIDFYSFIEDGINRIYPNRLSFDEKANCVYVSSGYQTSVKSFFRVPLDKRKAVEEIKVNFIPEAVVSNLHGRTWVSGNKQIFQIKGEDYSKRVEEAMADEIPYLWNLKKSTSGIIAGIGTREFIWFRQDTKLVEHVKLDSISPQYEMETIFMGFAFGSENLVYLYNTEIYELNIEQKTVRKMIFNKKFNSITDKILDVDMDDKGGLWIASENELAHCSIDDGTLLINKRFTSSSGKFRTGIKQVHLSKNHLWIFGTYGMSALDLNSFEHRFFGITDGLVASHFDISQVITVDNGRIATTNGPGLFIFHPDSLWESKSTASTKTIIKEIRIDGHPVDTIQDANFIELIEIPSSNKIVDVRFQALAFPKDDGVQYSYRLLGQQEHWIDVGENKYVSFSSLEPGNYTFQVKASVSHQNAPIKAVQFHIPTPLMQEWYMKLLLILSVAGLFYFLFLRRIHTIRQKENDKRIQEKKLMEIELKALRSQMNPHFMFNSLNSIKSYILQSETGLAAQYLSDFAHLVRLILQYSRESLITLEQELDTLMLYIDLEKMRLENEFTFSCQVDDHVDLPDIELPPLLLQPFVENAIWHGLKEKGNGHLSIRIYQKESLIFCEIEDNGIGRKASQQKKKIENKKYRSLGLGITNERIDIVNKLENLDLKIQTIDLFDKNEAAAGTRVVITIKNQEP